MKFSKTVLAMSLAVALQGVYAQEAIFNENKTFDENVEINIGANDKSSETATIRYVGIEAYDNHNSEITVNGGSTLTVSGNQNSLPGVNRLYGFASQEGSSLIIKGNSQINLETTNAEIRGFRVNGAMSLEGETNLNLTTTSADLYGIDVWYEPGSFKTDGVTRISLQSKEGLIIGVNLWDGSSLEASGEEFSIYAKSEANRSNPYSTDPNKNKSKRDCITGIQVRSRGEHELSTAKFNTNKIIIRLESPENDSILCGVDNARSITEFNGNLAIDIVSGKKGGFGINAEGSPKDITEIYLNGKTSAISISGVTNVVGLRPSGGNSSINIASEMVDISAQGQDGLALGTRTQYGGLLKISNENSLVNVSSNSTKGHAVAILNSTYGSYNKKPGEDWQFGTTDIVAKALNLSAKGANAYGIVHAAMNDANVGYLVNAFSDKDGIFIQAETVINTVSKGGMSAGIVVTNKNEDGTILKNKVSVSNVTVNSLAQDGGNAFAIYLDHNGNLELGTSRLNAVSEGGKAVGIFNNNGSVVKFTGDSVVQAETALQGNGTINVEKDAVLTLDGKILKDEWTGVINANGKVAYGVAESIATSDLANANDGTLLVIAGTEIAGNVNVGTVVSRDAGVSGNSLKVASDGTVLVRATDSYDGTSPLINVDSVRAEKGSTVHLLNAAAVAEGTKVFESNDADEDSLEDYLFTTDNFLKKVENNRIVGEKSANVFGSDLLIPNVVDAAVNATNNEGADRILGLTNKTLTQAQSLKAIHQIALMVPASGAQSTAINVANLQLDVIDTHASKLASHAEDKVGADLWIDMNGFLSKTNDYSAGSAKFGYKSDLAGVTIGSDYSFGNGYAAGVSVAFGKGSVRGQGEGSGVKNDVDYYGVNLYGVWSNDYFNTIGSVGYLQTKNEIKTQGFKGKPDAKTVSVGVRFEKPLALNEAITVTPHLGVRYKHVKLDSFNAGGFKYTTEKADIVEVPFGVAFNANLKAPCGADVKPFVDLTIAPNFGDRKVSNKIALAGTTASDSFDARIANNAMYNAKVGVNAVKGSHTFGLNYGIGGGNRGRVDQTLQARYTYRF